MYPHYKYSNGHPPPNMTQYLLGIGPPPPPTPQQQAVAQMNQVLDSGAFDGTQSHPAQQRHSNIQQLGGDDPGSMIKVDIPQKQLAGSSKSGPKSKCVYVTVRINAVTIEPQDFLAPVHANMELESEEDIELGWRVSDASVNKGFRCLKTDADVRGAFDEILNRNKSSRHVTPLSMVIKNILSLRHCQIQLKYSAKRKQNEDESDDDDIVVGIRDVLDDLHAKKPDLEYHQYESALHRKGIAYADAVSNFPDVFFVEEIRMAEGAVKGFKQAAKRAAKGKIGQK
ncbi:hypothetical protein EV368DRAFT_89757 [Lentinula lateritia]|nr:hypothetical protein EV368DRAFT_89757 [Lentinula lateritia]